jgi:hypothetical protein
VNEYATHPVGIRRHLPGRCPVSARWQPTQAELLAASARTATAMASASPADRERAAELEAALYAEIEPGPCDRLADPPPSRSRIDWTPEIDAEAAELEAAL